MRVLMTGASEGIGGATARLLAKTAGAELKIAMTASGRKPAPEALIADLEGMGAEVHYLTGDIGDAAVAEDLAKQAEAALGGMDLFIANAGAGSPALLAEQSVEEWDRMFNLNTRAPWVMAKTLYPALQASKGNVVIVASMSGMLAHPGQAAYSPAKAAVISLVRTMAQEWAKDGIRVNAVAPGMIQTPLTAKIYENDKLTAAREKLVPLGRIGRPEDIAAVIGFLASEGAAYVTGQTLLADGGICDISLGQIPGLGDV